MINIFNLLTKISISLKLPTKKPEKIFWWFPLICNLKCNHCNIGSGYSDCKSTKSSLSFKEKKQIILKIEKWICKKYNLSFIAGEPLLHKDMINVLSYAHQHSAITSITTNGTLINNEKKAKEIVKSGLDYISFSIDGLSSGIHDSSRGADGILDKVIKSIKLLKSAKQKLKSNTPKIIINSIIMKDNLNDLKELIKWVKKEKLDGITFQPIAANEFFGGNKIYQDNWYKKSPLWPNLNEVLDFIKFIKKMKIDGYPIKNSNKDFKRFISYFKNPLKFASSQDNSSELKSMTLTENGKIKICPGLSQDIGDILIKDLDTIWSSQASWIARKHIVKCKSQCKILANNNTTFY